jgi:hypothetical protein
MKSIADEGDYMAEHEQSIGLSDDWLTPPSIFQRLNLAFDLDPCSPGPDHWVPAKRIYTKVDDGLRQPWFGRVFMNPPFGGRRGQVPWLRKFFAHGDGIALVAARTSADWFHDVVVPNAQILCFPNGKTKFIRPDGSVGNEPGTGVVLIGMGTACCEALRQSRIGVCMTIDRTAAPSTRITTKDGPRLSRAFQWMGTTQGATP